MLLMLPEWQQVLLLLLLWYVLARGETAAVSHLGLVRWRGCQVLAWLVLLVLLLALRQLKAGQGLPEL